MVFTLCDLKWKNRRIWRLCRMSKTMSETHVANLPWKERDAFLNRMQSEDPTHVYFAQTVPPGHDAEADRLRALGMVQVFKCERPVKTIEVDRGLHRKVRRG